MATSSELSLRRETILVPTKLLDTVQEQSVELDCVLPDYYPDFFRLLSCMAEPVITQRELRDGFLILSLSVKIAVWYLAENAPLIQVMTQKLEYQKQIPWQSDLPLSDVRLTVTPVVSYINCRAVNSRRMDIRGAVRIAVQASGMTPRQVISDAQGLYIHCKKEPVRFLAGILRAEKRASLSESFSLAETQSPLLSVLRADITVQVTDTRCMAGKLAVRGEVLVNLLYTAKDGAETAQFTLPISQILEPDGISEEMPVSVQTEVLEQLITTEADSSGDIRRLHLDLQIRFACEAMKTASAELVTDLYSTVYPVTGVCETLPLMTLPQQVENRHSLRVTVTGGDAEISRVFAVWADVRDVSCADGAAAEGNLHCSVLCADISGTPMLLEHTEPFSLPCGCASAEQPAVSVQNAEYTLTAADAVSVQVTLSVMGQGAAQTGRSLLTDVQADTGSRLPQSGDFALRLYYAQAEESLWEIAKRYHTAADAIMEENDCRDGVLASPQMLLIPIVP